jgi:hypothetical protein
MTLPPDASDAAISMRGVTDVPTPGFAQAMVNEQAMVNDVMIVLPPMERLVPLLGLTLAAPSPC